MPNWCYTNLTIKGDSAELKTFFDGIKLPDDKHPRSMGYNILQTYYPCPQELKETLAGFYGNDLEKQAQLEAQQANNIAKYGFKDWYDWCNANWGTKWGDCDTECTTTLEDSEGTELRFYLESAWAPITTGLLKISEAFPNLYFIMEHREEAGFYYVHECVHNGNLIVELGFSDEEVTVEDEKNSDAWDEAWNAMWDFNDIMFWDAMSEYGVKP